MKSKKIAVLIPCYNEELTIEKVVRDFLRELPEAVIYVYDNNSKDRTSEIASSIDPEHVIVRKETRQGKGNVIRSMFRQINADCYVMVDGDDTYPAEHGHDMIKAVLEEGCDMVIGDRLSTSYFTENKRPFHNLGNKTVRKLVNTLFKGNVRDIMTGYRAFSRDFIKNTPVLSAGFEVETEMTIHALDKCFALKEVPIQYRDRPEGSVSKLNTVSDGLKVLKTIFTMCRDYKPFLFFGVISAILLLGSLGCIIPAVILKMTLLLLGGVVLFGCAVICFIAGNILSVLIKKDRQAAIVRLSQSSNWEAEDK